MLQTSMQDLFTSEKQRWLDEARQTAKQLLTMRESVTIDDVTEVCPRPSYLSRNLAGRVFNHEFRSVGFTKSRRPAAKGRWVQEWTIR